MGLLSRRSQSSRQSQNGDTDMADAGPRGSTDSKISSASSKRFAAKLFANLAPNAIFRRGKGLRRDSVSSLKLEDDIEAHLCQLAAMENYAGHEMYVKFTEDESRALEQKVLEYAVAESIAEDQAHKSGAPRPEHGRTAALGAFPYTVAEAQRILDALKSEQDPAFSQVAMALDPAAYANLSHDQEPQNVETPAQPPRSLQKQEKASGKKRVTSFTSIRKLLGLKKSKKGLTEQNVQNTESSVRGGSPRQLDRSSERRSSQQYAHGSYNHYAQEADEIGMEYSNGYIFPKETDDNHIANRDSGHAEQRSEGVRDKDLDLAIQASQEQMGYDDVLRDTKLLQRDLGHAMTRCQEIEKQHTQKHDALDGKMQRLTSAQKRVPATLTRDLAEAQHQANDARVRVAVLSDAVAELETFVEFINQTRPPIDNAKKLSVSIIKQTLQKLNLAGFDFQMPEELSPTHEASTSRMGLQQANEAQPSSSKDPQPTASPGEGQEPLPSTVSVDFQSRSASPAKPPTPARSPFAQNSRLPLADSLEAPLEVATPPAANTVGLNPLQDHPRGFREPDLNPATPALKPEVRKPESPAPSEPSSALRTSQSGRLSFADLTSQAMRDPLAAPSPSAGKPPAPRPKLADSPGPRMREYARQNSRASDSSPGSHRAGEASGGPRHQRSGSFGGRSTSLGPRSVASMESRPSTHTRWSNPDPLYIKRSAQVVHLFNEMKKAMPRVMEVVHSTDEKEETARSPRKGLTKDKLQAHDQSTANIVPWQTISVEELSSKLRNNSQLDMEDVCQLVDRFEAQDENARLSNRLSSNVDFPMARWKAIQASRTIYVELQTIEAQLSTWQSTHAPFLEEAEEFESMLDKHKACIDVLMPRIARLEPKWAQYHITWDTGLLKSCRYAPLQAAIQIMSNALAEVANLERGQSLQAKQCTIVLCVAVRVAFKIHQFSGGFNQDCTELFEKIRRLGQYYLRSQDPQWLKDTTHMTNFR